MENYTIRTPLISILLLIFVIGIMAALLGFGIKKAWNYDRSLINETNKQLSQLELVGVRNEVVRHSRALSSGYDVAETSFLARMPNGEIYLFRVPAYKVRVIDKVGQSTVSIVVNQRVYEMSTKHIQPRIEAVVFCGEVSKIDMFNYWR